MLGKRLSCLPGMPEVWRAMLLLVCVCTWLTAQTQGALVVSPRDALTEDIKETMNTKSIKKRSTSSVVEVYSVTVECTVKSRFAHTVMTSKALNKANTSQEIFFEVELPKTAFITNFSMEIEGQVYVGEVKEKEKAKEQYEKAVSSGQTAGLVKASGRKMEKFSVSVNIASKSSVTFVLTYEELLDRSQGKYEILTRVKPKERVQEFKIVTDIYEPQGLAFVDAHASFLSNDLLPLVEKTVTDKKAHISFSPTMEQQRSCSDCDGTLINGDFIIKYDVNRANNIGDIQIVNGYFVHFFAPQDLPRVPKNVVFVIDRSGSMTGRKIEQTREAMPAILKDLPEEDHFAIVVFGSLVETWRDSLQKATADNINDAMQYAGNIEIQGSTNMNDALVKAVGMLVNDREQKRIPERSIDMVILLTDGMPDGGSSSLRTIMKNVRNTGGGNTTMYCLGFGNDVDYSFLDAMSKENKGLARRIFEGSDAVLQLQGFYQEVSSPLLLKVDLRYPDNTVDFLTTNHFNQLFNGSEIVVAGKLMDNDLNNFLVEVFGQGFEEDYRVQGQASATDWGVLYPDEEYIFGDFTERLWAYLTIQQLLEKSDIGTPQEKENATAKALEMALRYSFVTPLTSMVVTKPETEDGPEGPLIADKLTEDQRQKAERNGGHSAPRGRLRSQSGSSSGGQSDVDGDPHFMIELPDREDALCFNINDKPGTIFNMVRDPNPGFFVNGQIIGKKFSPDGDINTYFGRFAVIHQKLGVRLEVSTQDITVFHDGKQVRLLWSETASIKETDMDLRLTMNSSLTVTLRHSVKFMVIRHKKIWKKRHVQQDYLGFYTLDSHHMSASVHGLLGQFYHGIVFEVSDIHPMKHQENVHATMYVKGHTLNVTRHWQKDFSRDLKNGESVPCWFVDRDGTGLIDGKASDYIVSGLFETTL